MPSARGANKAQAVGRAQAGGGARKGNGRNKETQNQLKQINEYLDLVARFRAKTAPATEDNSENEEDS